MVDGVLGIFVPHWAQVWKLGEVVNKCHTLLSIVFEEVYTYFMPQSIGEFVWFHGLMWLIWSGY